MTNPKETLMQVTHALYHAAARQLAATFERASIQQLTTRSTPICRPQPLPRVPALALAMTFTLALSAGGALAQSARQASAEGISSATARDTGAVVPAMATTHAGPLYLFQRARLAPASPSAMVTIDFTPAQWRVDAIDGPVATKAQLGEVLGNLQGIVVSGACASLASESQKPFKQACAFALRHPDHAGIMAPEGKGHVLGWALGAGPKPGAGSGLSVAVRYFGLLDPMRLAGPAGSGAQFALRYTGGVNALLPTGFEPEGSALILHNDRGSPLVPQAYAAGPSPKRGDAKFGPLRVDLPLAWATAVSLSPAPLLASAAAAPDTPASK